MSIQNSRQISDVKVLLKTGVDGSSIESIEKTGTSGLVDTYTVTLTNGEKTTFDVTNGNGIESIEKTDTQGLVDTYTITFENGQTTTYQVTNGSDTNAQIAERVENPATNAYAIGDYVVFNDQLCKVTAPIAVGGTFAIGTNLVGTTATDEIKKGDLGNTNLIKETVGWTGKNILPITAVTSTYFGVTFTVNDDGSIVLSTDSGGATQDTNIQLNPSFAITDDDEYIYSGCDSGSATTYALQCYYRDSNNTYKGIKQVLNAPIRISTSDFTGATKINTFVLAIKQGTKVTTPITIKPMVRKASILDSAFEPYHKDVVDVLREGEVIEGKNKLPSFPITQTINGITFTANSDGSVTLNGTSSAEINLDYINDSKELSDLRGDFVASLGVASISGLNWVFYKSTSGSWNLDGNNLSKEISLSDAEHLSGRVRIYIANNKTYNNVKISPMICTVDEWNRSHDYEPFFIPLKDSMFPRSEQRVLGAKNLLPPNFNTGTYLNVAMTNNGGVINLNGTANSTNGVAITNRNENAPYLYLPKGRYIFSAKPMADVQVGTTYNGGFVALAHTTTDGFVEFEITDSTQSDFKKSDGSVLIAFYIGLVNATAYNNVKVYPMVRLATDPDDTYVPYAKTNKELTDGLAGKQNTLTFDNAPTSGSNNPVKSGGVYSALQDRQPKTLASPVTINGASRTTVEQALGAMADTMLSSTGLTVQKLNCSITGGGYKEIGNKMVLVQIHVRTQVATNEDIVVDGFPAPAVSCALSAIDTKDNTLSGTPKLAMARINASGGLILVSDSDATLKITGVYCKS